MLDLDPEVPPEAEGETGGDADVVRPIVAVNPAAVVVAVIMAGADAIVSNPAAAFTARPWTTAIARR
jgi:hypothetical protein